MGAQPGSWTAWLAQLELVTCLIQPTSVSSCIGIGHRALVCNSEAELEASMSWAVKPQAPQVLPQGITGCWDVLHLHLGPGARWVAPCLAHNPQHCFGSGVNFL